MTTRNRIIYKEDYFTIWFVQKEALPGVGFEPTSPIYHAGASRPARVRVTTGGLALQRLQVADSLEIQPNRALCRAVYQTFDT